MTKEEKTKADTKRSQKAIIEVIKIKKQEIKKIKKDITMLREAYKIV